MLDNERINALVRELVEAVLAANGATFQIAAERQVLAQATELAVGLLQAFNDISYQLSEIVDRMDRMRP
jgi:hypothetical protein